MKLGNGIPCPSSAIESREREIIMSPQINERILKTRGRGGTIDTRSQVVRSRDALLSVFQAAPEWRPGEGHSLLHVIHAPRLVETRIGGQRPTEAV